MKRVIKTAVVLIVLMGIAAGGAAWYLNSGRAEPVLYRTARVTRGDLVATIGATGTVEPEELVDVGAQVAGQINKFGRDKAGKPIDYTSVVEEGIVLAQIDDSLYAADVASATATLEQNKAGVIRAQADLVQMKAKLDQAARDWDRAQKLGPSEALAQSSYDAYRSAYEVAKANVAVGEATIAQAKTAIDQSQATLQRAQRNLSYCTIKSPVKGVVIDRRVNIGQTVVSSLNAPSLFLIAKDLTRMQVWVPVNEADIGNITPGQSVSFTVDAYPGRVFHGEVGKVRLNAQMNQNVVTYVVEVNTDNSDGKLLPYLTANIQFELSRRTNVLLVTNPTLRWYPTQPDQVAPDARAALNDSPRRGPGGGGGGRPAAGGGKQTAPEGGKGPAAEGGKRPAAEGGKRPAAEGDKPPPGEGGKPEGLAKYGTLWVQDGAFVRPVKVRVGLTDGLMTEVSGDQVKEGMEVIVEEQRQTANKGPATTNPFTPQLRRPQPSSQPTKQ